jgi:hypothetical protein
VVVAVFRIKFNVIFIRGKVCPLQLKKQASFKSEIISQIICPVICLIIFHMLNLFPLNKFQLKINGELAELAEGARLEIVFTLIA